MLRGRGGDQSLPGRLSTGNGNSGNVNLGPSNEKGMLCILERVCEHGHTRTKVS